MPTALSSVPPGGAGGMRDPRCRRCITLTPVSRSAATTSCVSSARPPMPYCRVQHPCRRLHRQRARALQPVRPRAPHQHGQHDRGAVCAEEVAHLQLEQPCAQRREPELLAHHRPLDRPVPRQPGHQRVAALRGHAQGPRVHPRDGLQRRKGDGRALHELPGGLHVQAHRQPAPAALLGQHPAQRPHRARACPRSSTRRRAPPSRGTGTCWCPT